MMNRVTARHSRPRLTLTSGAALLFGAALASVLQIPGSFASEPPTRVNGPRTYFCQCKSTVSGATLCNHDPSAPSFLAGGTALALGCRSTIFEGTPGDSCKGYQITAGGSWAAQDGVFECQTGEITDVRTTPAADSPTARATL